jgi:hopene-associated glycosyltransferase HpnB
LQSLSIKSVGQRAETELAAWAPMLPIAISTCALLAWAGVLLLPWQPHRTRERLEPSACGESPSDFGDVAVLIPARNEAAVIAVTLRALSRQGPNLRVFVIDDESTDSTHETCEHLRHELAAPAPGAFPLDIEVIRGAALPAGWGGKLWALEQGRTRAARPYTLLLDADIELSPGILGALRRKAEESGARLVSIMALLRCSSVWERLLVPPFVFFFKLLYPFARVNADGASTAAAAGGCILIETPVLHEIGGFAAIRAALIDDCSLAACVKSNGHQIWLGLSHAVVSRRGYANLDGFWQMVARTAYTQLRYSLALLLVVTAIMVTIFVGPFIAPWFGGGPLAWTLSLAAVAAMAAAYFPTVRFYRLHWGWVFTLPIAGVLFLAMTWSSALSYWRGVRAEWKNRAYAVSSR